MSSVKAIRPYCAKAQYPGLDPFVGGTVVVSEGSRHDEIIAELDRHFATFLPPGYIIIEPLAGSLFFVEDEND